MAPPVLKKHKKKVGRENTLGGVLRLQKPAQRGGLPRNTIPQQPFAQPSYQLLLSSEIWQSSTRNRVFSPAIFLSMARGLQVKNTYKLNQIMILPLT